MRSRPPRAVRDPAALAAALAAVERDARGLPWAANRPWRVASHVATEGPWLVVDLHDLSVALALRVLGALDAGDVGAARLVTGSGRHTGGRSKLRDAVIAAARERGWRVSPVGPARLEVVRDPARHPFGGGVPLAVWLVLALVLASLAVWWLR
jgi:hypothetical protein